VVLASTAGTEGHQAGVAYYDLDIRAADQMGAMVREVSPVEVYHLAAMSSVASSWNNPRLAFEVNVIGTSYSGLMSRGKAGQVYNVCSGTAVSFAEIISEFESMCRTG